MRFRSTRRIARGLVIAVVAIGLAACGGGGGPVETDDEDKDPEGIRATSLMLPTGSVVFLS